MLPQKLIQVQKRQFLSYAYAYGSGTPRGDTYTLGGSTATRQQDRGRRVKWTTGQNDIIRELGHRGVQAVHDEIIDRYGIDHTLHAIEAQASRIHASLKVRTVCPECGVVGVYINRQSGMCPLCTELMHLNEEIAFNEILQAECERSTDAERIAEIRRERDMMRKRNSRLCRKHGLKTRRERGVDP